jgi:class 3 adenylate cyclase
MNSQIDVRHVLSSIHVQTLVLHRSGDRDSRADEGRYVAERIPGARFVELAGEDHAPFIGADQVVDEVEAFLTSRDPVREPNRVLATVLFTDIVGSTEKAVDLGDRAWAELLERHNVLIRRQLSRFQGTELDTAGDGFFASFDGPARAVRCAVAITGAVSEVGLAVRAGLHTGECELVEGKVGGIAVHIGARVAQQAGPGEVVVSSTVKDIVAGSGICFRERGLAPLKGVPGEWRLFRVESV